jgi:hypothetical protein
MLPTRSDIVLADFSSSYNTHASSSSIVVSMVLSLLVKRLQNGCAGLTFITFDPGFLIDLMPVSFPSPGPDNDRHH